MKSSIGDKALLWGTLFAVCTSVVGGVMWLTQIAYTATSTADTQKQFHDEVSKKLDALDAKVDKLADGQARIEGRLSQ